MPDVRPLDRSLCATAELLDLGAGRGKRLLDEARRFGVHHPLGIELNPAKVAQAQARGEYGLDDASIHGPKPLVEFDRPVYFAFDVFFFLRSDAPTVRYSVDTDDVIARPFLVWSDRRGSTRSQRWRRAAGFATNRFVRRRAS